MSGRAVNKVDAKARSKRRGRTTAFKMLAAVGAIAASLAVFTNNLTTIRTNVAKWTHGDPTVRVNVGWITVEDPSDVGCIATKTGRFKLSENRVVGLVLDDCVSVLSKQAAAIRNGGAQTIGRSFFLLLENRGPRIEGLELVRGTATETVVKRVSALDPGVNVAVCMGYEGRGGSPARGFKVDKVRVLPAGGGRPQSMPVHELSANGYAISDCGKVVFSYPHLPNR